ncbi:transcription initiation factor TFIID subunit 3 [Plodia interpunctella]|uniref:transcription initiation factor TFIID subunit 3 n=1 Tax=Plodia interpunctella TaxID=58824 RepID=UPI002368192F|nr:transcription initiation factor TFIID subunit 3 [Plodia interpunctella]
MSEAYAREILRRNVAQICQTIGWNGINSTPMDIMVHVLEKYIQSLGTQASRYAEQFNRTEPNLHDLGLVFRDLHVQLPELADYTRCVPPVPPPVVTEKFPKPKESNLNFLKPGSHEVVTRPMHVHEHLPPMYPEKERDTPAVAGTVEIQQNGIDNHNTCASPEISVTDSPEKQKDIFKRPIDPVSLPNSKRPRLRLEEEERTREISSVMMTMSGFLSPAREGKLPEARPPTIVSEKHYDKHKPNSHHSNPMKVPILDKSDKKSKKKKLLNGKIMKSKRKDKSHKGESSKSKDSKMMSKHPPGYPMKSKDVHPTHHNHVTMPAPKPLIPTPRPVMPPQLKNTMPPPSRPLPAEPIRPVIKQEPVDPPSPVSSRSFMAEDSIPVPRKIPISKSPLVSGPHNKPLSNSLITETEIKKEVIDEEEKLASQPDRSKINIFKRISNKSKEDRSTPEVVADKSQSDPMISRLHNSVHENSNDNRSHEGIRVKTDLVVNNNDSSAVDLSQVMDLRTNEVINIDEDSMDIAPAPAIHTKSHEHRPSISINKSLQVPFSKEVASVSPKIKKEKKHKDKKDKAAKLEAKLLKKQQQQLAMEIAQMEKHNVKIPSSKTSKSKKEKLLPLPPGFPFFPGMAPGRGMMPGPGLIPNPGLIPGADFYGLANNPALRGLAPPNLLSNPFALGGLSNPAFLPGNLGQGLQNPLIPPMGNFPHSSRSMKIPSMLRRPSLEVIPVDNDEDRGLHKSPISRDKDRHDKHKSPTIPNILQKHKKSHKEHKSNLFKMPLVQPDITIELNPPKSEPVRHEPPRAPPVRAREPEPEPEPAPAPAPVVPTLPEPKPEPIKVEQTPETSQEKDVDVEKKKDKSHKKDKKDKDGIKIKKKKDKKDKNKDKSEKKREKEEKLEMKELKDKIKKEKKEKKKEKSGDGLVPKLTLKLSSSNSNSPMPPSSPDIFKLNIKPVVKKEEEDSSPKQEVVSREHSRSPELAQISALVTRPPKPKHSKHNHVSETEGQASPPAGASSPTRKNHPPSSHSKYKRILIKPLSKKGNVETFDDDVSIAEEQPTPVSADKPAAPLPTPYYVDEHGNKIWVCPACGRPDNGSPMIGCDGCDGWYHWVCVGIREEPSATEDWFCKSCVAKRAAMVLAGVTHSGRTHKRRGRKPKGDRH